MDEWAQGYILLITVMATAFLIDQPMNEIDNQIVNQEELLIVDVAAHIIMDEDGIYNSERSEENVLELFGEANRIWKQADVRLNVKRVNIVEVNYQEFLRNLFSGNVDAIPYDYSAYNAYFVNQIDANGIALYGIRSFVQKDVTTVHPYRTVAHEMGHLFTLQHTQESTSKLMYRGANGEVLYDWEIEQARKAVLG